jgi:hypothetical protein
MSFQNKSLRTIRIPEKYQDGIHYVSDPGTEIQE